MVRTLISKNPAGAPISSFNYNERLGINGIIGEVTEKYPFIKKIILYGSKARGDFYEESDIDLLFITDSPVSRSLKYEISDIIYNHELANDIVVSAILIPESEFTDKVNPFINKVKREGMVIWSRE